MDIESNLTQIVARIHDAEKNHGRLPGSVKLIAVSKGQRFSKIKAAVLAGQRYFGESYLQEALGKINALAEYDLEWHFIGSIQSNKTQLISQHFAWAHSVSRLKIARRLSEQRPAHLPPLNVCIEVNSSAEKSKSGASIKELPELAFAINRFKRLRLRGLMVIPELSEDKNVQLANFNKVAKLQAQLVDNGLPLDTLSMGMSNDFEAAIAAGSTLVRIGTAVFGPR